MATFRHILAWVLLIGVVGVLIFPCFIPARIENHDTNLFKYSQFADSLIIYTADYDDLFPPTTSDVTLRVVSYPYIKNSYIFMYGTKTGPIHFNFNLAGVSTNAPPYPGAQSVSKDNIVLTYTRNLKEHDQFLVYFLSGRRGTLTNEQLLKGLEPQFDRKHVKLFPADCLADQDPLKGIK